MYEQLPEKLKTYEPFCLWRREDGKKIPYQINGSRASVSRPYTFSSFEDVINALGTDYDGIGVLNTTFTKIDIDDCVKDGRLSPLAEEVVDTVDSYTELSPSGTGVHIICHTPDLDFSKERYYINNRKIHMEIYVPGETDRFFTITGHTIRDCDINNRTSEVQILLNKYMLRGIADKKGTTTAPGSYLADDTVIGKASASKQAEKFAAL